MVSRVVLLVAGLLAGRFVTTAAAEPARPPNVLFIVVDDMNDWVGALGGHPQAHTPNIDRLAARGLLFTNAHAAAPVCNASRAAALSGLRPGTTGIYENNAVLHEAHPDVETLPRWFRRHGYVTVGGGKVFHHMPGFNRDDDWDEYFAQVFDGPYQNWLRRGDGGPFAWPEGFPLNGLPEVRDLAKPPGNANEFDWGPLDVADAEMGDGRMVEWAARFLAHPPERPFFLAAGIYRPHLPFYAPRGHFDRHPVSGVSLPPVLADDRADLPAGGLRLLADREADYDLVVRRGRHRELVQAYLAGISFADALVGRLLDALDASPAAADTIVVFWSDHGWHLGEKQTLHKRTLWERSTRIPLIVAAPGVTRPGTRAAAPVDTMALFPTLVELCGLERPARLDGESLVPLLRDPAAGRDRPAITTHLPGDHAVRDARWRYIRYADGGEELYDHEADPHEWRNLAADPQRAAVKARLAAHLPDSDAAPAASSKPKRRKPPQAAARGTGPRPNILLIVSEDNGPELGCYGDPHARTPCLDRLAAEGERFDRGYVAQAGCSPSRASFLTGLHVHQHGQLGLATWGFRMYSPDTPNVVRSLAAAGYRTGLIGKLHVNPESAFPFDFKRIPSANFQRKGLADYARHAAEFFAAGDAPFFLSVNYPDAHGPWLDQVDGLPERPVGPADVRPLPAFGVDTPQLREAMASYYNCLARLDTLVGDLLAALDRSGKADDTLVVYLGDHGIDMLRGKRTCYENGLRIPLLIRWPGVTQPGRVRQELVSTIDLVPTFLDAAGAAPITGLPGRSLRPLFAQGPGGDWRTHLFAEFHTHAARANFYPQRSVRDDRYKLIENLLPGEVNPGVAFTFKEFDEAPAAIAAGGGDVAAAYETMRVPPRYELYDLALDPFEFRNLAADPAHRDIHDDLAGRLTAWREATADPLLDPAVLARLKAEVLSQTKKQAARDHDWQYPRYFFRTAGAGSDGGRDTGPAENGTKGMKKAGKKKRAASAPAD